MKRATILTILLTSALAFGQKFDVSDLSASDSPISFSGTAKVSKTRTTCMVTMHNDSTQDLLAVELTGEVTVNTDFAETEVDARQVNLTRFPLFFPEKRAFFLEGSNQFTFGLGLGIYQIVIKAEGYAATAGVVVLIALLLLFGLLFTLFAMWFDMESNKDLR